METKAVLKSCQLSSLKEDPDEYKARSCRKRSCQGCDKSGSAHSKRRDKRHTRPSKRRSKFEEWDPLTSDSDFEITDSESSPKVNRTQEMDLDNSSTGSSIEEDDIDNKDRGFKRLKYHTRKEPSVTFHDRSKCHFGASPSKEEVMAYKIAEKEGSKALIASVAKQIHYLPKIFSMVRKLESRQKKLESKLANALGNGAVVPKPTSSSVVRNEMTVQGTRSDKFPLSIHELDRFEDSAFREETASHLLYMLNIEGVTSTKKWVPLLMKTLFDKDVLATFSWGHVKDTRCINKLPLPFTEWYKCTFAPTMLMPLGWYDPSDFKSRVGRFLSSQKRRQLILEKSGMKCE